VSRADACAGLILVAVIAYAVLGGADYGGGVLDLFARGPRAARQRAAIAKSMGPVWEANHVWLVFVLVGLFTAFPTAFEGVAIAMFLPLLLALVGIVARGIAFAFRGYGEPDLAAYARFSRVFGVSSVVTPFLFGTVAGGLAAAGRDDIAYRGGEVDTGGVLALWTDPFPLVCGGLALAACAFLAATFLTVDMRRIEEDQLVEDFRRRALVAGAVAGAASLVALPVAAGSADRLYDGLTGEALPLVVAGALAGGGSMAAMWWRRFAPARMLAAAAVVAVVAGWGIAQHPVLVGPDLTVQSAAATSPMLGAFIATALAGLVLMAPALYLLFVTFRRDPARLPPA
jgi:cytochrome d ubiquinol oxidase subunit II